jgi:murein DD-endopeptidase MepM/ murein hydrolase activator NlpD
MLTRTALLLAILLWHVPAGAQVELLPPVNSTCITSPFGPRRLSVPIAGHAHPGVDLRAPIGATVRAAARGRVVAIRRMGLGGLSVTLHHADGMTTFYGHLGSVMPALAQGKDSVEPGEALGRVGRTGMSFGPHIYFSVAIDGKPVDPEPLLAVARCPT